MARAPMLGGLVRRLVGCSGVVVAVVVFEVVRFVEEIHEGPSLA